MLNPCLDERRHCYPSTAKLQVFIPSALNDVYAFLRINNCLRKNPKKFIYNQKLKYDYPMHNTNVMNANYCSLHLHRRG
jgi:hypothetical protein